MRTINELFGNSTKVWIYLPNDDAKDGFYECASDLNLHFSKGTRVKRKDIGTLMSLTRDGEAAYISMMIWNHAFLPPSDNIEPVSHEMIRSYPKIDFWKFINGADDYILKNNPFRVATADEIVAYEKNAGER